MQSSSAVVFSALLFFLPVTVSNGYLTTADTTGADGTLASLQTLVQQQASLIEAQQSQLTATANRLAQAESRLAALESSDKIQNSRLFKSVAFTARYSHDPVYDVGEHAILKFDAVQLNVGGGYDPHTGIFTTPVAGIYVLYVGLRTYGQVGEVRLVNNGTTVDFAHSSNDGDVEGTLLATVHLDAGQKLWVQHWYASRDIKGGPWTDFSGFLLRAD